MADFTKECLLIFTKNPEKGKVKTRLAKNIGDDKALDIYQQLLRITKSEVDALEVNKQVWYSNYIDEHDLWSQGNYNRCLQEGKGLGMRMQKAFQQAFANNFSKVVIIGSDCASLSTDILRQAFTMLDTYQVTMGPSHDGGYYLLGMTDFYPELFEQKEWSTSSVFEQTISQLQDKELSYHLLPTLNDIDTEEDLRQSDLLSL